MNYVKNTYPINKIIGKQKLIEDLKEKFRNQLNEKVGDQIVLNFHISKNYLVFNSKVFLYSSKLIILKIKVSLFLFIIRNFQNMKCSNKPMSIKH